MVTAEMFEVADAELRHVLHKCGYMDMPTGVDRTAAMFTCAELSGAWSRFVAALREIGFLAVGPGV